MKQARNKCKFILCFYFTFLPFSKESFIWNERNSFNLCVTRNYGRKMIKFSQDSHKLYCLHFTQTCVRKIYPYLQGSIRTHILQIIWQYKKNFHKTILEVSKSLFFSFSYTLESSVDWFLQKQSEIFWKCVNFTSIDYNVSN